MLDRIKRVAKRFKTHNMMVASAGVAFYGLLALAPTMLAMVSVYGLVTCDPQQITDQVEQLAPNLGEDGKGLLINMLKDSAGAEESGCDLVSGNSLTSAAREIAVLGVSVLVALWSASGAVAKLLQTISVAYQAQDDRAGWKVRLLSYGFTAFLIVGFVILLAVLAVLPNVLDRLPVSDTIKTIIGIGQFPLLAVLFAGALTILYRYGPDRSPHTPWWNPGAIVGTGLFLFFAVGLSFYSSAAGAMPASYGVIGSVAALMIFLQLTTIAVLVGAEVNADIEGDAPASTLTAAQATRSSEPAEPVSFGKAMTALAALLLFGRGRS